LICLKAQARLLLSPTSKRRELLMLQIDPEKVCFIIIKARQFHAKVEVVEPAPGSNPSDEDFREVLEDYSDDATYQELHDHLTSLNSDEMASLVALMWVGRGDFDRAEWTAALAEAYRAQSKHGPDYLIGTPLLADFLEEGLSQFGLSCEGYELGRL
jgi:hypothetical protein